MEARKAVFAFSAGKDDGKKRKNRDRLSDLPDPILHHIFSFMDMIYVIQTSTLSKSWRYVWTSLPFLRFNSSVYFHDVKTVSQYRPCGTFDCFVNQILLLRKSSRIQTFNLCSDLRMERPHDVCQWISVVAQRNVEHFDLCIRHKVMRLPRILFTCKSLTTLILDLCVDFSHSKFPSSIDLPLLSSLCLKNMRLTNAEFLAEFLSGCPVLETLEIVNPSLNHVKILTITIPVTRIKKLIMDVYNDSSKCQIIVSAPHLTSFRCGGVVFSHYYSLENISSLEMADLDLEASSIDDPGWLIKYLKSLCNVKSLSLSNHTILQVLSKAPEVRQWTAMPFINFKYLKLSTAISKAPLQVIMYLLQNTPNIETLVLKTTPIVTFRPVFETLQRKQKSMTKQTFIKEYYFSNKHAEDLLLLQRLKSIEVRDAIMSSVLDFLKILVKKATALEKVTVFTPKEARKFFADQLLPCLPDSSNAEILFR